MTKFELWVLRWVLSKAFRQGYTPFANTRLIYEMVRRAWVDEFKEDSIPGVDADLRQSFENTQWLPLTVEEQSASIRRYTNGGT